MLVTRMLLNEIFTCKGFLLRLSEALEREEIFFYLCLRRGSMGIIKFRFKLHHLSILIINIVLRNNTIYLLYDILIKTRISHVFS